MERQRNASVGIDPTEADKETGLQEWCAVPDEDKADPVDEVANTDNTNYVSQKTNGNRKMPGT